MPIDGEEVMQVDEGADMARSWNVTSSSGLGQIVLQCSVCKTVFTTPERLYDHVTDVHDAHLPLWHQHFANKSQFQTFIRSVEEHRTDRTGYVHPDLNCDPNHMRENLCDTYYAFCEEAEQPLKRRKLDDSSGSQTIVVSCTAFIHVYVYNDGSHTAIFCLDHTCGSDSNNAKINTKANTKCHKRNHDEMMREDPKDGRRYSNPEANNNNNNGELTSCEDLPESARSTLADLPESSKIPMRYGEEVKRKNASTASDPPDMGTLLESINEGLSQAHIKGGRSHSVEQTTYEPEAMDVVNRAAETATETCPCA
ncbi:hypothetical protein L596_018709 [Steinernema carpocapsae]|uniref:C2H2-type domain-containing protein n=1 Tax=Steinernema carpocapsae TaxID=34508 RepID=A0A4U5N5F7_STECR|nr:hypothetical protein L596_018709 [Steinernema carpocapsae]